MRSAGRDNELFTTAPIGAAPDAITNSLQLRPPPSGYWLTTRLFALPMLTLRVSPTAAMESSTPTTDEFDSAGEFAAPVAGAEARKGALAGTGETGAPRTAPLSISREQCSACGATLAPDQRYCVECGERCGAPRLPFTDRLAQSAQQQPSSRPRPARARMSVNNTAIAGIGTLLLAMGVGVLIGRSGNGSSAKGGTPAIQVVTVPGAGAAAATPSGESSTSTSATSATSGKSSSKGATTTKSTGAATKKAAAPPAKAVVKVGSPGKGPGYQKGKFTGNFFGG